MTRTPIHPGEILADELAEINITAFELASKIHVSVKHITDIIAGQEPITVETGMKLGKWFGTGPKIWLNLQQAYELDVASLRVNLDDIVPRKAA